MPSGQGSISFRVDHCTKRARKLNYCIIIKCIFCIYIAFFSRQPTSNSLRLSLVLILVANAKLTKFKLIYKRRKVTSVLHVFSTCLARDQDVWSLSYYLVYIVFLYVHFPRVYPLMYHDVLTSVLSYEMIILNDLL